MVTTMLQHYRLILDLLFVHRCRSYLREKKGFILEETYLSRMPCRFIAIQMEFISVWYAENNSQGFSVNPILLLWKLCIVSLTSSLRISRLISAIVFN